MEKVLPKIYDFIDKIGKHNFILIIFLFIVTVITGLYTTFSIFTSTEPSSVVGGIPTYKFILNSGNSINTITIPANTAKGLEITVSNNSKTKLKYGIYYSSNSDLTNVNLGYTSDSEYTSKGIIKSQKDYLVKARINNSSDDDVTITFGLKFGLENNEDLQLDTGQTWLGLARPLYLTEAEIGSYISYEGVGGTVGSTDVACKSNGTASSSTATEETESPNSCSGQNAREDLETSTTTYGYCYNSSYKYTTTGWRLAYINKDKEPVIISAGSPECNARPSATTNNASYVQTANTKALKYCNPEFVDGDCSCVDSNNDGLCDCTDSDNNGICDEIAKGKVDAWAINDLDFYTILKNQNGFGKRLSFSSSSLGDYGGEMMEQLYCLGGTSTECGSNNPILNNGGYYWFAARLYANTTDSLGTAGPYWNPSDGSVLYSEEITPTYGLRPLVNLSKTVIITGGSGTMSDPYTIQKRNNQGYLKNMEVGSYVKYTGSNGCTGESCNGQNANYSSGTTNGYCHSSSYQYNSSGWRIIGTDDGGTYIVSAGAPECACTGSDGVTLSSSCSGSTTASQHIESMNEIALKYCNIRFSKNHVCNSNTTWAMNGTDFTKLTNNTLSTCYNQTESNTCGYNNDLINIGGFYKFATHNPTPSTSRTEDVFDWSPYDESIGSYLSTNSLGIRPVIYLDLEVMVTGGSGTKADPYQIDIDYTPPTNVITEEVLEPNATNDSSLDFSKSSNASSTNGIYVRNGTQNSTYPIYYYRGNVNNNLIFADFCWKIVRTTETGGLKLIYNGVPSDGKCNNTGTNSQIGTKAFNSSYNSLADVGYMYGTPYTHSSKSLDSTYVYGKDVSYANGTYTLTDTTTQSSYSTTLNDYHYTCFSSTGTTCTSVSYIYYVSSSTGYYITLSNGKKVEDALSEMLDYNTTSSTIKGTSTTSETLDYWYYTNIEQKGYSNYIEDTIWCNDRSVYQLNGWNPNGGNLSKYLYFSGYNRALNTYQPNLTCSRQVDRFTVDDFNGNGDLTYPVGLLTVDETMLAGGANAENNSYYLYNGITYWTGTPYSYASDIFEVVVGSTGGFGRSYANSTRGICPLVSLAPGFALASNSGTGTGDSPYVVE